jgi:DNA-binding NarL/FixJ family response regulator
MRNDEEFIFELMSKDANGFLPNDKSLGAVVDAIYCVMKKDYYQMIRYASNNKRK